MTIISDESTAEPSSLADASSEPGTAHSDGQLDEKPAEKSAEKSNSSKNRPLWQTLFQTTIFFAIGTILLEGVFGLAGIGEQEIVEPDTYLGCRHIPNKLITWRLEGYSHDRFSSQGLRDIEHALAKPTDTIRIALLGDSTTEGLQVPFKNTYGQVLGQLLNEKAQAEGSLQRFEVINFACSSYSTGQKMLTYEKQVRQFHPDLVLVLYNLGDATENIFVPESLERITPRPYFYLDEKGQIATDRTIIELNKDKFADNPTLSFLRRHSRIFGVLSGENLMLTINEKLYSKIKRLLTRLPIIGSRQMLSFVKPSYALQDQMKVTNAIFERLNKEVEADGAQFALLLYPNAGGDPAFAKQHADLTQLSEKAGFPCLNLTSAFINSANARALFLQYHCSAAGHKLIAEEINKFFSQHHNLIKLSTSSSNSSSIK